MRKRYIFFDIDGTLAADGYENAYIPESAQLALKKLKEAGHFVAIATGRAESMARDILEMAGLDNMVSDGGWGLTIDGKVLYIKTLPKEDIIPLVEECKEKGLPWGLQLENRALRTCPDDSFMEYTHDTYIKTVVKPDLDPAKVDRIYKMYIACHYPKELEIEGLKTLPYCRFHEPYLFVEPLDKGEGIKDMLKIVGGDPKDVIVFGDAKNDISMFLPEWTKVAMGNACDELKAIADYVTTDVKEDGVYNACVHLNLFED
ncbi:MAG: HAD family hydrolase [Clostridia bacterium]|nr:HAD family hydrolase [Clostridia bacterium]